MCGYSILDAAPLSTSNSFVAIDNLQLGREKPQGSSILVDVLTSADMSASGNPSASGTATAQLGETPSFHWNNAIKQSALFLAISHAFLFATEPSTRADMKGPFWRDYFRSVGNLRGWDDSDGFLVNYIGHPI
jgi:hypothetical protein